MRENIADFSAVLSPLEEDVLEVLWPDRKMRVREIHEQLKGSRKAAISSVAVICDRLHSQKIVGRDAEKSRGGTRYIYYPLHDKKGFEQKIIQTTVDKLIEKFGSAAISHMKQRCGSK
jgi:predicted transcriptional regulator